MKAISNGTGTILAGLSTLFAMAITLAGCGAAAPPRAKEVVVRSDFREQLHGAERGEYIFGAMGCFSCHGHGGKGGIENPNYLQDTIPDLDGIAERMMLFDEEDAEVFIEMLEQGDDLQSASPPFRTYNRTLAQYDAISKAIQEGRTAGKKDPDGPQPVNMPTWGEWLTDEEIDADIANLIRMYDWD